MDEERESLFLDALMGIESELKKLNSFLEAFAAEGAEGCVGVSWDFIGAPGDKRCDKNPLVCVEHEATP